MSSLNSGFTFSEFGFDLDNLNAADLNSNFTGFKIGLGRLNRCLCSLNGFFTGDQIGAGLGNLSTCAGDRDFFGVQGLTFVQCGQLPLFKLTQCLGLPCRFGLFCLVSAGG